MAEKNKGKPFDPSLPLKSLKQEKYVQGLATGISQREAYSKAYATQNMKPEGVDSKASTLFGNVMVRERYQYLIKKFNEKIEKRGTISRERMLESALYMLDVSMGKEKTKTLVKDKEGAYVHEDYLHDTKAFGGIWDKIMVAMNYYPKESKELDITVNKADKEAVGSLLKKVKGVKK